MTESQDMGTVERRAREKDAKRRSILRAAIRCFARKGYDDASLDDVARLAEVAKGTVYLYFKSKADLFASIVLDHGFDPFTRELEAGLARCRDARSALRSFAACFRRLCLEGEREIFQLFLQIHRGDVAGELSDDVRGEADRRLDAVLDGVARWIDRGRESGELSCPEGPRVARLLWALCVGVAHLARQGSPRAEQVLEDAMEGLIGAYSIGARRRRGRDGAREVPRLNEQLSKKAQA